MRERAAPRLETRRASEFERELVDRARSWIPTWGLDEDERDFGRALLRVAALFSAEVAERLDRTGDKMRRGFLDWLAIAREAARPARLPVVLRLTDSANVPVPAPPRTQLQADVDKVPVVLETEADVTLLPGKLAMVIAADAGADTYFAAPPGFTSLDPIESLPTQWRVKSFAAGGQDKLQLDSELGLAEGLIVEIGAIQYRLEKVDKDIVTVDPLLPAAGIEAQSLVRKVDTFVPFEAGARNLQKHALYLGHADALNLEAAATIEVIGASGIGGESWHYWGKSEKGGDTVDWQPLALAEVQKVDSVVLEKPAGAIEPRDLGPAKGMRWLRAMKRTSDKPFRADELGLRVNAKGDEPCPPGQGAACGGVEAEAMSNATPLALNNVFYPLGRQPKQFDAFYLGCGEAFSKGKAKVCLGFEFANPTFAVLASYGSGILAGVGKDRALHLFAVAAGDGAITRYNEREALQPSGTPLDSSPPWRVPIWPDGAGGFCVAVAAGAAVWVWHENAADRNASKWESFGNVPEGTNTAGVVAPAIEGLVYLADPLAPFPPAAPSGTLVAVRGGDLAVRGVKPEDAWSPAFPVDSNGTDVELHAIAPVRLTTPAGTGTDKGLVGIGKAGTPDARLYRITIAGACTELGIVPASGGNPPRPTSVLPTVPPVAFEDAGVLVAVALEEPAAGMALVDVGGSAKDVDLGGLPLGFDIASSGGTTRMLATLEDGGVVSFDTAGTTLANRIPASLLTPSGSPSIAGSRIVVPGTHSDAVTAVWDPTLRLTGTSIGAGVVVPSTVVLHYADPVVVGSATARVIGPAYARGSEAFYPVNIAFSAADAAQPVYTYDSASGVALLGTPGMLSDNAGTLELAFQGGVDQFARSGPIVVDGDVYTATLLPIAPPATRPAGATLTPTPASLPAIATPCSYRWLSTTGGRAAAVVAVNPPAPWDAPMLENAAFGFTSTAGSQSATGKVYGIPQNRPFIVVMDAYWSGPTPSAFVADAAIGPWERRLGDNSSNPELSWEYWNGTGWSSLGGVRDDTFNFKSSGTVTFTVPAAGIAQGDWAGKKNAWIRARLVGGDYGQEKITVKSSTDSNGVTTQTIERSNDGVRPPSVVSLRVCYGIYEPVKPRFVLAEDSGTMRDQSDANRTPGAKVEAFVPLSWTLGRLGGEAKAPDAGAACPAPCDCAHPAAPGAAGAVDADTTVPARGRGFFLGFTRPLSEASVNVMLDVATERDFDALAPVRASALVESRFQPVTVSDGTRALGEMGLLTLAFAEKTTSTSLFGGSLHWLRVQPRTTSSEWSPALAGAYLNAVWASARETLTRELLGSSEGAPDLVLKVARPPVLRDTLVLRVREPLGDEERERLVAGDEANVVRLGDPPEDWVLWRKVADPLDEAPTARVYSLDELTGEIRFGNGRHGAIPPVGRDSVNAFTYARTEAPSGADTVPANGIRARMALNVVSPVESVEAAYAAQDAAGGAPAEPDERVLRYGSTTLRHRGRAVTLRDFEDIALQGSPEIAQARAFMRGPRIRLVVVVRGTKPQPGRSQVRELKQRLLRAASASIDPEAFLIAGPRVRNVGVQLVLRVLDLSQAGSIEREARTRLASFFDTTAGGAGGEGFPLGSIAHPEAIARVLIDVPGLEGIKSIEVVERMADAAERAAPPRLASDELLVLEADGVRCEFEITGATT